MTSSRAWIALLLLAATAAHAQSTLTVPGQFPSIQSAINAAAAGETVLVSPGVYVETIDFLGKDVAVRSTGGASLTTIDAANAGTVVRMTQGEPTTALLEGFTIRGGLGAPGTGAGRGEPGGILCDGSSPTIRGCVVSLNQGGSSGGSGLTWGGAGGIALAGGGSATIEDCIVRSNFGGIGLAAQVPSIEGGGGGAGGIEIHFASPTLTGCVVRNNVGGQGGNDTVSMGGPISGQAGRGGAGGLRVVPDVSVSIRGCSILDNFGGSSGSLPSPREGGAGGIDRSILGGQGTLRIESTVIGGNQSGGGTTGVGGISSQLNVTDLVNCTVASNVGISAGGYRAIASSVAVNTIIRGNSPDQVSGFLFLPSISFSNVQGGYPGTGNIDVDPDFFAPARDDYRLSSSSPCVDAGNAAAAGLPPTDFEGEPRVAGATVDIGADEVHTIACATGNVPGAAGPVPVLTVNGSSDQLLTASAFAPVQLAVASPSGIAATPFLLFAWPTAPDGGGGVALPAGVGSACFDPYAPDAFLLASSFGPPRAPLLPATLTPWSLTAPAGLPADLVATLQGVILDATGALRVTNAIGLSVR